MDVAPLDVILRAVVLIPFVATGNHYLLKFSRKSDERGNRLAEHAMTGTNDVLTNIKVVRGFATEKVETRKFALCSKVQAILQQRTIVVAQSALFLFIFLL